MWDSPLEESGWLCGGLGASVGGLGSGICSASPQDWLTLPSSRSESSLTREPEVGSPFLCCSGVKGLTGGAWLVIRVLYLYCKGRQRALETKTCGL